MRRHYEQTRVTPVDVEFEQALLINSIHMDAMTVGVYDFEPVQSSDGDDYFEPDFK